MEQSRNRQCEIDGATLVVSGVPIDTMSKYEERKLEGVCTRCGAEPAKRDVEGVIVSSLGERCYENVRRLKARSGARRRAVWKRKKLCGQCGRARRPGGKLCPRCTVRFGATPNKRDHYEDHQGDLPESRWAARVEKTRDGVTSGYQHRRFRGQAKRGRQSIAQLDEQDIADARRCVEEGWQGLAYYRSEEVQALPRIQREDVRREALAKLLHGQRWLGEILERHEPKSRQTPDPTDDD